MVREGLLVPADDLADLQDVEDSLCEASKVVLRDEHRTFVLIMCSLNHSKQ